MLLKRSIVLSGLVILTSGALPPGCASPAWAGSAPEGVTAPAAGNAPVRSITVVGEGKVSVRPDVARATVGVVVADAKVKEAVVRSRTLMVAVLAALKRTGVVEKDILTSNYSIYYEQPPPRAEGAPSRGRAESKGRYNVTNMVLVTIRDIEKMDAVLDAVTGAGANQVWGVNFAVDNPDSAAAKARELAVAQARTKAGELARASGVRLGPVLSISEDVGGRPVPMARMATMEASGGSPISPGELTFSAQLQVVYGIE